MFKIIPTNNNQTVDYNKQLYDKKIIINSEIF